MKREKWLIENEKIALPYERSMRKGYRIGLRLAQIEAIRNNKKEYKSWSDIKVQECSYFYHLGLKELEKPTPKLRFLDRLIYAFKILFKGRFIF